MKHSLEFISFQSFNKSQNSQKSHNHLLSIFFEENKLLSLILKILRNLLFSNKIKLIDYFGYFLHSKFKKTEHIICHFKILLTIRKRSVLKKIFPSVEFD